MIDKEKMKLDMKYCKKLEYAVLPKSFLELAELYLADKLCEPMSENDIASIINKLLMEHTHFHNGEQRFTPKSIVAFREYLVAELSGKIPKQFVPATRDEIGKIISESWLNTSARADLYYTLKLHKKISEIEKINKDQCQTLAKALVGKVGKNVSKEVAR